MIETQNSRRRFLVTGAKAIAGVAVASQGMQWLTGCSSSTTTDPSPIWAELDASISGDVFLPGSMGYFDRARPWALQYAGTLPAGIAQCANEDDVRTCIVWAKKNGIALVARSGGHSYAAYSMTTGLLLDLSRMNSVTFDGTTGNAIVGGGARNKDAYAALRTKGMAITHGRCKEVGVGGLVLGGGIGFNMRAHGLTCDRLVSTRIVTADGTVQVCSATENTDLFWAIRGGGGGNFGVHTQFEFAPFPAPTITVFNITWDSKLEEVFTELQQMALAAPTTLGLKVSVIATPNGATQMLVVNILGQLVGTQSELGSLLQSTLNVAAPASSTVSTLEYWDGQEFLSEEGDPEYSHERSRFATSALTPTAITTIFRNMRAWPGTSVAGTWKYFLMGGEINTMAAADTAFVHRGSTMITSIDLEWMPADEGAVLSANYAWLDAFHEEMASYTSAHCYQNFIDRRQTNYLDAYYGANLDRLKRVKQLVDPTNMFTYPQAIPRA